jgi:hypothetical protein
LLTSAGRQRQQGDAAHCDSNPRPGATEECVQLGGPSAVLLDVEVPLVPVHATRLKDVLAMMTLSEAFMKPSVGGACGY